MPGDRTGPATHSFFEPKAADGAAAGASRESEARHSQLKIDESGGLRCRPFSCDLIGVPRT